MSVSVRFCVYVCMCGGVQDSEASDSESDGDHMLIKPMFVSKKERDTVLEENTQEHEVRHALQRIDVTSDRPTQDPAAEIVRRQSVTSLCNVL